ncbi:hypothetical protein EVAR_96037_1 [Eumeta japonica]|uniref:Uncharacterized protein n=1 Tax=Eumeta variegata TaxID=151549 RepID=A0A4C1W993_EUMVA|nr:hypothetical protein EVAR_96037_1 [Eumeta japonica]
MLKLLKDNCWELAWVDKRTDTHAEIKQRPAHVVMRVRKLVDNHSQRIQGQENDEAPATNEVCLDLQLTKYFTQAVLFDIENVLFCRLIRGPISAKMEIHFGVVSSRSSRNREDCMERLIDVSQAREIRKNTAYPPEQQG